MQTLETIKKLTLSYHKHISSGEDTDDFSEGVFSLKCDVKRFTEDGVEFQDGTTENAVDTVVFATGKISSDSL